MKLLKVAILGTESSGKSTLAAALAARHRTVWVPEYLREFVDTRGRVPVCGIALIALRRTTCTLSVYRCSSYTSK